MSQLLMRAPTNLVSSRARIYWALRGAVGWLVVAAIEASVLAGSDLSGAADSALAGVTAALAAAHLIVMPLWRYRVHRWEIDDLAAYTQSGWFAQERRIAPLARIQTVDTRRGPLEQLFGLANVTITTASAKGPLTIHALDGAIADQVVWQLTQRAQLSGEDGT